MSGEVADVEWLAAGASFSTNSMVHYAHKPARSIDTILADIDLVITGPHASAAFPSELRKWIDPGMTRRLQHDFTDVSTAPIARAWAECDPHVLYVENPHPRAVRDANRPRPDDLAASLREAFARLETGPNERASLDGVDAIRPVTFSHLPVLRRPESDSDLTELVATLTAVMTRGVDVYEATRDELIDQVIEAKLRRLSSLSLHRSSPRDRAIATRLDILSIHDTMNRTSRPDGAICRERAAPGRLPGVVALSNRGDDTGEARPTDGPRLLDEVDILTMPARRLRSVGHAYRLAFGAWDADDVSYNRPYLGGYETQRVAPYLRRLEPVAHSRDADGRPCRLRLAAWQNEFLREFLLGPGATDHLMAPGVDWCMPPPERVAWIAERLRCAHDLVRTFGSRLDPQMTAELS